MSSGLLLPFRCGVDRRESVRAGVGSGGEVVVRLERWTHQEKQRTGMIMARESEG